MRTFAHFDATGKVHALIAVDAPEGVNAGLVPQHGVFVDEVDGVDLKPTELDPEAAREIFKKYRVALPIHEPRKLVEVDQ
jgi:hypothetical protein